MRCLHNKRVFNKTYVRMFTQRVDMVILKAEACPLRIGWNYVWYNRKHCFCDCDFYRRLFKFEVERVRMRRVSF